MSKLYEFNPDSNRTILDNIISDLADRLSKVEQHPINDNFSKFESFIKLYPKILNLANSYKKNPGELIDIFVSIGEQTMQKSQTILLNEVNEKVKSFVTAKKITISNEAIDSLDNLIRFLKEKNQSLNEVK